MAGLKRIIEENPVIVLLTTCALVAAGSAGVVEWFCSQSLSLEAQTHKINISRLKETSDAKIGDLTKRLVSIERSVGESERLYLDVASISIPAEKSQTLSQDYKSYGNGTYYVSPPNFVHWPEKKASQLDIWKLISGTKHSKIFADMLTQSKGELDVLLEEMGMLWVSDATVSVQLPQDSMFRKSLEQETLDLTPFLFVIPIDDVFMQKTAHLLSHLFSDNNVRETKSRERLSILLSEKKGSPERNSLENIDAIGSDQTDILDANINEDIVETLNNLSRGDLAGFLLTDALVSNTVLSQLFGGTFKVVSADKKGNIMYLRLHIIIPTVSDDSVQGLPPVVLDQEYFFIGTPKGGVLVRTFVPSVAFQTEAYVWTHAWLSLLRVPV